MKRETYFSDWRICFLDDPKQVADYLWHNEKEEAEILIATADQIVQQSFLFNQRWDMERTSEPVVFPRDIDWLHQPPMIVSGSMHSTGCGSGLRWDKPMC